MWFGEKVLMRLTKFWLLLAEGFLTMNEAQIISHDNDVIKLFVVLLLYLIMLSEVKFIIFLIYLYIIAYTTFIVFQLLIL